MKMNYLVCPVIILFGLSPVSAGDFVNLGFENPNLTHATPDALLPKDLRAPTAEALQGWTLTADVLQTTTMYVTGPGGDRPPIALTASVGSFPAIGVDYGKYTLYLANPSLAPNSLQPIYHLSQLGKIPEGATQLVYYRYGPGVDGPGPMPGSLQILINGKSIPYFEAGVSYADVSAFAGQEVSLEFVFPKGGSYFDIAGFSIVPEPSTYALLGLGAVALGWQCRRRSHS